MRATFHFFIILYILSAFTACNENFSGGSRTFEPAQFEEAIPIPQAFITRLSNVLLVSGTLCRGDETTQSNGQGSVCNAGQYLVKLDNVNTCNSNGHCTDFAVIPIVAELEFTNTDTPGYSFYEIVAKSPTTDQQDDILDIIILRSDVNGNGTVLFNHNPI